jgi:hypothetical protein
MEISNSMVREAVKKAVETGLLPRNSAQNEYDWEIMRAIIHAAVNTNKTRIDRPAISRERVLENW